MGEAGPALYTVEEAAKLLRIGRTKAYALTQEWRATGGESGLPVVDFGNVLRVPRAALEKMLGVELTGAVEPSAPALGSGQVDRTQTAPGGAAGPGRVPATETAAEPTDATPAAAPSSKRRNRTTKSDASDQLDLFDVAS